MMDRPFVYGIGKQLFSRAVLACALMAVGCQSEVVHVSGRVTLDGKPLAHAVVTFQPVGSGPSAETTTTGSVGRTDSDGRFVLRLVSPERNGAAVGDHIVTISMPGTPTGRDDAAAADDALLPLAWRDGSRQFRVPPSGTRQANFDIKPDPPADSDRAKGAGGKKKRGG